MCCSRHCSYAEFPGFDSAVSGADSPLGRVAEGIKRLDALGWPASLVFLTDEAWAVLARIAAVMREVTGNEISYDMLAWHVDPRRSESGFSPHRDRQPDDARATFREDGMAMYTTCWVALTDATPENSCLHMIPKKCDPGYTEGDKEDVDPMAAALPTKEAYQHIRALPMKAGDALLFTHRIIHWGSSGHGRRRGHEEPLGPRVSLSVGFSDPKYEKPYLKGSPPSLMEKLPSFEERLALISAQMISYYQRFDFPKQVSSQLQSCRPLPAFLSLIVRQL